MEKIGVIGCGLMGSGITATLLEKDYTVYVYDVNEKAVERLAEKGAHAMSSAALLAEKAEVIILSLPSPALIREILLGSTGGIMSVMQKGSYILDMSTNDVELTKMLYEEAKRMDIHFFDCPLSGGPEGARNGTLTIMTGGCEARFVHVLPILQSLGTNVKFVGESGSGQVVKLCNNMLVAGIITLLSEVLMTGEKAGVPQDELASIFQTGSGSTRVMDVFGPNILEGSFDHVIFSLANMMKDIHLYKDLADVTKTNTAVSLSVQDIFEKAVEEGKVMLDSTCVYEVLTEFQGEKI